MPEHTEHNIGNEVSNDRIYIAGIKKDQDKPQYTKGKGFEGTEHKKIDRGRFFIHMMEGMNGFVKHRMMDDQVEHIHDQVHNEEKDKKIKENAEGKVRREPDEPTLPQQKPGKSYPGIDKKRDKSSHIFFCTYKENCVLIYTFLNEIPKADHPTDDQHIFGKKNKEGKDRWQCV
jgi:hypothetical protein